uniref:4'-phosphopantetheinyl transferase family protein n=1 Tax=Anaplasma marginale TaxID=770 RepID=UPI0019D6D949
NSQNYLNLDPKQIQFKYSDRGKPSLADNSLEFNLSHSQDLAIYGFTKNRKIGVDLEYLRYMPDAENLANRFFLLTNIPRSPLWKCLKNKQLFFKFGRQKKLI